MKKKKAVQSEALWYCFLHLLIFFISFGGVLSKAASRQEFLSLPFILLYLAELFILFSYAILWQQVLKHIPLTVAFCNKAVGMIWTTLWGVLIFKEGIPSLFQCMGIVIVLVGVVLVVTARE